jgi:hypothetical protein
MSSSNRSPALRIERSSNAVLSSQISIPIMSVALQNKKYAMVYAA